MGLINSLRSDRLIQRALIPGISLEQGELTSQIRAVAPVAIPKICRLLRNADRREADVLTEVLARIITRSSLGYCEAVLDTADPRVGAALCLAFERDPTLDPNRLLDWLDKPAMPRARLFETLHTRRKVLDTGKLLRCACKLQSAERASLFALLGEIADGSLERELLARIDSRDAGLRVLIVRLLARLATQQGYAQLKRLLNDPDKNVRLAALEGLCEGEARIDAGTLCRCLRDPDLGVQNRAVEAIIHLNEPGTAALLLEPLQDASEFVRRSAVEVLNAIVDPAGMKGLLMAIEDSDWWVRSRAADALGLIGGPRVIEAVIALLKDEDENVRRTAVEIINAAKDPQTYDALVTALEDTDWWVRERAVDGLGAIRDRRASPVLARMLDATPVEDPFFTTLIRALAKLGAEEFLAPLRARLAAGPISMSGEARELLSRPANAGAMPAYSTSPGVAARPARRIEFETQGYTAAHSETAGTAGSEATCIADRSLLPVQPEALQPGDVIGDRYRYLKTVGKGAFGTVCLMDDLFIQERVILKFLHPRVGSDDEIVQRFARELRLARRISHPNVVRIFDMVSAGGSKAIAMEYFQSTTLAAELKLEKRLSVKRTLAISAQICAGMEAAHRESVIHRDLKPGNVLVNSLGEAKIVDFGIAAAANRADEQGATRVGLMVGTPTYMAPEQVIGGQCDARTDIYSLGVMLYEMLAGRPPYIGSDGMNIMYQHVRGVPEPVVDHNRNVSRTLNAVVLKAMAARPEERYPSMESLRRALALSG
jgi:eukaryotic-like serine/threonine-protein kinase